MLGRRASRLAPPRHVARGGSPPRCAAWSPAPLPVPLSYGPVAVGRDVPIAPPRRMARCAAWHPMPLARAPRPRAPACKEVFNCIFPFLKAAFQEEKSLFQLSACRKIYLFDRVRTTRNETHIVSGTERWPSGRRRSTGNAVYS